MHFYKQQILLPCLFFCTVITENVSAVTDAELETLEKQIEQQEQASKQRAVEEARQREETKRRKEAEAKSKADEEKLRKEREQRQAELDLQRAQEERMRLEEEKRKAEESQMAEEEKIRLEKIMEGKEIALQANLERLRKQEELNERLMTHSRDLALVQEGATLTIPVEEDPSSSQNAAIDGISNNYGILHGWSASSWKKRGSFLLVSLKELSLVNRIRFLLWDKDGRYYHYRVETSSNQFEWDTVSENNTGEWRGWQDIVFKPKELRYIKITGLFNSSKLFFSENPWFHVVEIEVNGLPLSEIN